MAISFFKEFLTLAKKNSSRAPAMPYIFWGGLWTTQELPMVAVEWAFKGLKLHRLWVDIIALPPILQNPGHSSGQAPPIRQARYLSVRYQVLMESRSNQSPPQTFLKIFSETQNSKNHHHPLK